MGDSITHGHNLEPDQTYPAHLQAALGAGVRVGNFGYPGATLSRAGDLPYWELPEFAASTRFAADVVVIQLGTNDARALEWPRQAEPFERDATALIAHYRAGGARVFVLLPPPVFGAGGFDVDPRILADEVVPRLTRVAREADAPLIDAFTALTGEDSLFPDRVHPSAQGAQRLALVVQRGLSSAPPAR